MWRRRSHQRLGKLAHAALDQQTTGELDQVQRGDRAHPGCLALLRQRILAFAQEAVVSGGITFNQLFDLGRLRLPKGSDRSRRVEPVEEHIAGQVVPLLDGNLVSAEIFRTLTIDGNDFIGQQAQVVLGVGVADAVPQAALIGGQDMRYAVGGAAYIRARLPGLVARLRPQAQANEKCGKAEPGQWPGNDHADSWRNNR
ncbi:hypothetical protein D3C76_1216970 [compost metagenome]